VIKLKRSSQLIGQFGHVTASAFASNLKSTVLVATGGLELWSLSHDAGPGLRLRVYVYGLCAASGRLNSFCGTQEMVANVAFSIDVLMTGGLGTASA
jgi:low affinity Fe/Cu permease